MRTHFVTLTLLVAPLAAQTSGCESLGALDTLLPLALTQLQVPGLSLQVTKNSVTKYEKAFGAYALDQTVPIASASKWLSAATIMTLVDLGLLSLDDKVSRYLPSFTGSKSSITLRQCLSHTSGLPPTHPILDVQTISLRECADFIATLPLASTPGSTFEYGELSMQVAGRVAEVVAHVGWEGVFAWKLATPLSMTGTNYQALGGTTNPRIGAGAKSALRDYSAFLKMLLNGGLHGGNRVLQSASVAEILKDQTRGATLKTQPFGALRYGLGCWRDRVDPAGNALQLSSMGIYGFSPWIDLERNVSGVFLVRDTLTHVYPVVQNVQAAVRYAIMPIGVACYGNSTHACRGPVVHNALGVPKGANAAFGLISVAGPALAPGVLVLGTKPHTSGVTFMNTKLYIDFSGVDIAVSVTSTSAGEAFVPLPTPAIAAGLKLYSQLFWVNQPSCGGSGPLSATNALTLTFQ